METALFSPSALFNSEDQLSSEADSENGQTFVEREHRFPGMVLLIREFSFHPVNANLLWPGASVFADWLIEHQKLLRGRRIIELGSGTGALAVFLKKSLGADITTSDFDDEEIEENIAYNCAANGISALPHIRHTWGEEFLMETSHWDLIIASDILLYVKQYPNLINSLSFLLKAYKSVEKTSDITYGKCSQSRALDWPIVAEVTDNSLGPEGLQQHSECLQRNETMEDKDELPRPCFLMSWRRRIPKEDEASFFNGCENAGLMVQHFGSRVFCINLRKSNKF
eukprot:Gb_09169 [translate_table: standard]